MVRYLARQANVDSCYVVDMIRGCERPQTLFVFDMIGNTRKLFFPLSKYMQTYTKSGDSLVFLSLEEAAAKKAIEKAFRNQVEGKGFSLVEVLSACPTNWGMSPSDALKWIDEKMIPYYPLGVYKDRSAAKED